jgi:hypothetical protein
MAVTDLGGSALGYYDGQNILIDDDAAGHGWFVDFSPADSVEFAVQASRSTLVADVDSEAYGRMDLLTVLMHELGHAMGFGDNESGYAVMSEDLEPGVRLTLEAQPAPVAQPAAPAVPGFDLGVGAALPVPARIEWQTGEAQPWTVDFSPYAAPESSSNFADYLFKVATEEAGFDQLGQALLGAKGKGKSAAKSR